MHHQKNMNTIQRRRVCFVWKVFKAKVQLQRVTYERLSRISYTPLVTLHNINISKVPLAVIKIIVKKLNCTQKASGGALLKLGTEACICNSYYDRYQGPAI